MRQNGGTRPTLLGNIVSIKDSKIFTKKSYLNKKTAKESDEVQTWKLLPLLCLICSYLLDDIFSKIWNTVLSSRQKQSCSYNMFRCGTATYVPRKKCVCVKQVFSVAFCKERSACISCTTKQHIYAACFHQFTTRWKFLAEVKNENELWKNNAKGHAFVVKTTSAGTVALDTRKTV